MTQDSSTSGVATYARLLGYVRRYWLAFVVSIAGLVLHSAAEVAFVDLLGYITDTVATITGSGDSESSLPSTGLTAFFAGLIFGESIADKSWMVIPVFLILVSLIRGLGYLIGSYGLAYVANYLVHALRVDILDKYLKLPFGFFDRSMPVTWCQWLLLMFSRYRSGHQGAQDPFATG